jgi:hypothetical protein
MRRAPRRPSPHSRRTKPPSSRPNLTGKRTSFEPPFQFRKWHFQSWSFNPSTDNWWRITAKRTFQQHRSNFGIGLALQQWAGRLPSSIAPLVSFRAVSGTMGGKATRLLDSRFPSLALPPWQKGVYSGQCSIKHPAATAPNSSILLQRRPRLITQRTIFDTASCCLRRSLWLTPWSAAAETTALNAILCVTFILYLVIMRVGSYADWRRSRLITILELP